MEKSLREPQGLSGNVGARGVGSTPRAFDAQPAPRQLVAQGRWPRLAHVHLVSRTVRPVEKEGRRPLQVVAAQRQCIP